MSEHFGNANMRKLDHESIDFTFIIFSKKSFLNIYVVELRDKIFRFYSSSNSMSSIPHVRTILLKMIQKIIKKKHFHKQIYKSKTLSTLHRN